MKSFKTMLKTELILSLRGMDMFIFAICMPIVVLIVLGLIFGDKPAYSGAEFTFLQQSFGALSAISICAGGVMGLPLVISDYRSKQILKRFHVTPVKPIIILLVQVTIYALYSVASLILLYVVAKIFFGFVMNGSLLLFLIGWLFVMISMFSIGLMVGGIAKNTKSAGIIASILYFPMIIFSGATLPYEVMPIALQKFADVLPLTQGIKILKATTVGQPMDDIIVPILIITAIATACSFIAVKWFKWE